MRELSLLLVFLLFVSASALADSEEIALSPWQPEDEAVISFDVLRNGRPFGEHILTFERFSEDHFTVETKVDLRAGLGPVTLFRYRLRSREVWRGGDLVELSGSTSSDGKKKHVEARLQNGVLEVNGSNYIGSAPADIIPSSHWNILEVASDVMLSTEDGSLLEIAVEEVGRDQVQVGAQFISATHYHLKSDINVDLWYDDYGRWVKLTFAVRGQDIEYKLKALY